MCADTQGLRIGAIFRSGMPPVLCLRRCGRRIGRFSPKLRTRDARQLRQRENSRHEKIIDARLPATSARPFIVVLHSVPAQRSKTVKGQKVTLGIRPEPVRVGGAGSGALSGTLRLANIWVSGTMFYLSLADGEDLSRKADGLRRSRHEGRDDVQPSAGSLRSLQRSGKQSSMRR